MDLLELPPSVSLHTALVNQLGSELTLLYKERQYMTLQLNSFVLFIFKSLAFSQRKYRYGIRVAL